MILQKDVAGYGTEGTVVAVPSKFAFRVFLGTRVASSDHQSPTFPLFAFSASQIHK